jgi:hypothetical protein
MSVVGTIIRHGASSLENRRFFGNHLKGFGALGKLGAGAVGAYFGYSYGQTYGNGVMAMYAVASMFPVTGTAIAVLETGKDLGDWAYRRQQDKRRSSFAKNRIDDRFGTINMMRQASIQNLSRDHSSRQRVLGNEAFFLHR